MCQKTFAVPNFSGCIARFRFAGLSDPHMPNFRRFGGHFDDRDEIPTFLLLYHIATDGSRLN